MGGAGAGATMAEHIGSSLLLISVGNTRTRFAASVDGQRLDRSAVMLNADLDRLVSEVRRMASGLEGFGEGGSGGVVIASVNDPVADALAAALRSGAGVRVSRFGSDVPIPVEHRLPEPVTVGQDRLLNALGAYWKARQACVVIDAGTAVTVDFVDGTGVFHGGAIAPGVQMMLDALHARTAALPGLTFDPGLLPTETPFGTTTAGAMTLGVARAVQGLAHILIDQYADFYGAYPQIVATGGDAHRLFDNDPLVERVVPELTLIGMLAAVQRLTQDDPDAPPEVSVDLRPRSWGGG